jgi:DNA replication protein
MERFRGFPAKMQFTSVPNVFFSNLLPQISDIAELKTTLHILGMLYRQRGYPRFVAYSQLLANRSMVSSLSGMATPPEQVMRNALEMAVKRGTLLHLVLDRDGVAEDVYFLNDESSRQAIARIQSGELKVQGLKAKRAAYVETEEPPDIFTLYEQNIGMLTPMIAEELREAERLYPQTWIKDAIKEAVNQNIRKKSYILAILERWSTEGKGGGTYQRDSAKKTAPDKYIKQKYGHMVQR